MSTIASIVRTAAGLLLTVDPVVAVYVAGNEYPDPIHPTCVPRGLTVVTEVHASELTEEDGNDLCDRCHRDLA